MPEHYLYGNAYQHVSCPHLVELYQTHIDTILGQRLASTLVATPAKLVGSEFVGIKAGPCIMKNLGVAHRTTGMLLGLVTILILVLDTCTYHTGWPQLESKGPGGGIFFPSSAT